MAYVSLTKWIAHVPCLSRYVCKRELKITSKKTINLLTPQNDRRSLQVQYKQYSVYICNANIKLKKLLCIYIYISKSIEENK